MKVQILLICIALVGTVFAIQQHGDGRPGCVTDIEMRVGLYRNFWDPTAYWKCETRNVPAEIVRCNDGAFQDKLKKCVSWADWEWEDMVDPPSKAE